MLHLKAVMKVIQVLAENLALAANEVRGAHLPDFNLMMLEMVDLRLLHL